MYGIDIDAESINYATAKYSNVTFKSGDVLDLEEIFKFKFDLIYLFNSLYAFTEQSKSLSVISNIAETKADLLIFEYLDLTGNFKELTEPKVSYWTPIKTDILKENLSKLGWKEITFKDISLDYERWYKELCSKIKNLESMITERYGKEWFAFVYDFYLYVVTIIEQKILGGVIVHAKR